MPLNVTPVAVNSSGSRNDSGKAIPRTQAITAYEGETQLVVDGVPFQKGCNGTKPDGTKCGNKLMNATQVRRRRCLGHLKVGKAVDNDEG